MMPPIGGRDEVWRGSLQLTFINFEIQFYGYFMLDLLVIAIITIPIPTIYGTCNEVHSLDARAGFGVHMGHLSTTLDEMASSWIKGMHGITAPSCNEENTKRPRNYALTYRM